LVSSVPDAKTRLGGDDDATNKRINALRDLVDRWRTGGYEGATPTTRSLLEHWTHPDRTPRLYWAQLEALETIIYLYEVATTVPTASGILEAISCTNKEHNDLLPRIASKMATGTGKTVVMALIIAWQACNSRENPVKFSNQFVVITPGLIIRDRLQELLPRTVNNVYDRMDLVPYTLRSQLKSAKIKIANYQSFRHRDAFAQLGASKHEKHLLGVSNFSMSRESDSVMIGRTLFGFDNNHNVVVINDEAHHCYKPGTGRMRDETKEDKDRAAIWFNSIKLINSYFMGKLVSVYDLSATPKFIERGEKRSDSLFPWSVSDFPLTDAIESGMVKIPRVPVGKTGLESSVCRNIFDNTEKSVRKRLDKNNLPNTITVPLDSLYESYKTEFETYKKLGYKIPPVFIIVVDSIHNARVFYEYVSGNYCNSGKSKINWTDGCYDLFSNNPKYGNKLRTILVHSRIDEGDILGKMKDVLKVEARRLRTYDPMKSEHEILRDILATVGRENTHGEQIRCVVSVSMLTEGWDAKNVTHVFGFRKFGTQLICEQVSGRALRRTDTDSPEWYKTPIFAEIFGVPFNYMLDVKRKPGNHKLPKTYVLPKDHSDHLEIEFPLVISYTHRTSPNTIVTLNPSKVDKYVISPPTGDPTQEELTGIVGETKNINFVSIHLQAAKFRLAKSAVDEWFQTDKYHNTKNESFYQDLSLFAQMRRNVDMWFSHQNITLHRNFQPYWVLLAPHLSSIPHEIVKSCNVTISGQSVRPHAIFSEPNTARTRDIKFETKVKSDLILDSPKKCHHNCAPCDSLLEIQVAKILDRLDIVLAWMRNHSLKFGWSIPYYFDSMWRRYYPDFIVRLVSTSIDKTPPHAVIEVKGIDDERSKAKAHYARHVWAPALSDAGYGRWEYVYITNTDLAAEQLALAQKGGGPHAV